MDFFECLSVRAKAADEVNVHAGGKDTKSRDYCLSGRVTFMRPIKETSVHAAPRNTSGQQTFMKEATQVNIAPMALIAKNRRLREESQRKILQVYASKSKVTPMMPIQSLVIILNEYVKQM